MTEAASLVYFVAPRVKRVAAVSTARAPILGDRIGGCDVIDVSRQVLWTLFP